MCSVWYIFDFYQKSNSQLKDIWIIRGQYLFLKGEEGDSQKKRIAIILTK